MLMFTSAAWALGLAVSPPYVEIDASPGSAVGRTLSVRNTTPHAVEVKVYLNDWWYQGERHAFAPVGSIERSAAEWSTVGPGTFRLAADERREVQLELQVPPDARGGSYAVVFFEARARQGDPAIRMASLVMVDSGNAPAPDLTIGRPGVELSSGQPVIQLPVDQDGEIHTFAQMKGIIRREDGSVVTRVESEEWRFLPEQERVLEAPVDQALAAGIYTVDGVVVGHNARPTVIETTRFVVP